MENERLKEITLEIVGLNDTLAVMNYVHNLSSSDIQLFYNYIKNSKYWEMNLYSAIMSFSCDYLRSINCALPNNINFDEDINSTIKKK